MSRLSAARREIQLVRGVGGKGEWCDVEDVLVCGDWRLSLASNGTDSNS